MCSQVHHRRRKRGGQGGPGPPNNLRGGANIPFGPPNNPPTCTGKSIPLNSILEFSIILYIKMRNVIIWHLFIKIYWAHDVEMTSMRRHYVASTSLRRHVPAGNLAPPCPPPPQNSKPWPPQYSKPSYAYVHNRIWYTLGEATLPIPYLPSVFSVEINFYLGKILLFEQILLRVVDPFF